ncbi:MAG: hypothetical protein ACRCZD_06755 [Phycicoccus sp.]
MLHDLRRSDKTILLGKFQRIHTRHGRVTRMLQASAGTDVANDPGAGALSASGEN